MPDCNDLGTTVATLALGVSGGVIANILALPLPWMIGPLIAVAGAAMRGVTLFGQPLSVPLSLRLIMVPVIGVMLGAHVTPSIAAKIPAWWMTISALVVFVPISTLCVAYVYRRCFGFDPATAFFSAVPGGLMEMAIIGDRQGGDPRFISLIHFCRLTMAVVLVPFALRGIYGPVGSASLSAADLDTKLTMPDGVILIGCAAIGFVAARAVRLPGAPIVGPVIFSAIAHGAGLTAASPPYLLVQIAQIVIGTALGARFAGFTTSALRRGIGAVVAGFVLLISLTVLAVLIAAFIGYRDLVPLGLAYAPGGVTEMSLIALSLNFSVAFVTIHHITRIFLAVMLAPWVFRIVWGAADKQSATHPE